MVPSHVFRDAHKNPMNSASDSFFEDLEFWERASLSAFGILESCGDVFCFNVCFWNSQLESETVAGGPNKCVKEVRKPQKVLFKSTSNAPILFNDFVYLPSKFPVCYINKISTYIPIEQL